jgi:hypothetical protein
MAGCHWGSVYIRSVDLRACEGGRSQPDGEAGAPIYETDRPDFDVGFYGVVNASDNMNIIPVEENIPRLIHLMNVQFLFRGILNMPDLASYIIEQTRKPIPVIPVNSVAYMPFFQVGWKRDTHVKKRIEARITVVKKLSVDNFSPFILGVEYSS